MNELEKRDQKWRDTIQKEVVVEYMKLKNEVNSPQAQLNKYISFSNSILYSALIYKNDHQSGFLVYQNFFPSFMII